MMLVVYCNRFVVVENQLVGCVNAVDHEAH